MKKLSKNNKGFTLVEMIVVLVILAILAAILIPGLLGYIDDAKNKQIEVHGKAVYTAAQSAASKFYAKNENPQNSAYQDAYKAEVIRLSEIDTFNCDEAVVYFKAKSTSGADTEAYKVAGIKYSEGGIARYLESGKSDWSESASSGLSTDASIKIK